MIIPMTFDTQTILDDIELALNLIVEFMYIFFH